MSAPRSVRLDLLALGLDDLAVLARHPHAPAEGRRAFVAVLTRWTRDRVTVVTRTMSGFGDADREDLVQDFLMACLTRHLRQWIPERGTVSAFLFVRLRSTVIDAWRRRQRLVRRQGVIERDVQDMIDEVDSVQHKNAGATPDGFDAARDRASDDLHAALVGAVAALPERQRTVVRCLCAGRTVGEAAALLRVHPSTASRERGAAFARLREMLAPWVDRSAEEVVA
jgi:RNA polymerase sigma factor (sigma-70 family)